MIFKYLVIIIFMLAMSFFAYGFGIDDADDKLKESNYLGFKGWAFFFVLTIVIIIWG